MAIQTITIDTEQWAVVPRVLHDYRIPLFTQICYGEHAEKLWRDFLAAAPRPEAGQQDGAVTDYGSIGQQSEFIQLFNAAFEALKHGHSIGICWDLMKCAKAELNKLAKQQPAPRPVPTCERLPTLDDADPWGNVLAFSKIWDVWSFAHWGTIAKYGNTIWLPTGLVRPAEVKP